MTKIFWPNSGSQQSWHEYKEFTEEEARKLVQKAFNEKRIVVDISTNQRVIDVSMVGDDSVIRVYPLVGGG